MYRDYPHRSEKVRVVYNVQLSEIMEDMGSNVPRISATLDNRKVEFQSHMIEVEGMINNQTIEILIDSGAIHSYIDPKMVERFHLQEESMKNISCCICILDPKENIMRWLSYVQWA
jgi:hypothetical protein